MINKSQNILKTSQKENIDSSLFDKYLNDDDESNFTMKHNWSRPDLNAINPKTDDITFQFIDCDLHTSNELASDNKTIVRLYGVTEKGNSVMAHIRNYCLFLYIRKPEYFDLSIHKNQMIDKLNKAVESDLNRPGKYILSCSVHLKQSIYGFFEEAKCPFLCIYVAAAKHLLTVRKILENGYSLTNEDQFRKYETFNSNIDVDVRAITDLKLTSCGWLQVKANCYQIIQDNKKSSRCQLEIEVNENDVIRLPCDGEWMKIAPLRILSFDIECISPRGTFPDAKKDPVIQIANMVQTYGLNDDAPTIRNIFTLNSCSRIIGAQILSFDKEGDLLNAWSDFFRQVDPDVVTGYNIQNFDFPYLFGRAQALNLNNFSYLSRLYSVSSGARSTTLQSKQFGRRETHFINLNGRFLFDMFQVLTREYKLRSYSLNSVSYHFLGEQKEDVHHTIIGDLQNGDEDTRRRLAVYCLKDAYLPMRLMNKLMSLINHIEMARVTGVNLCHLLTRGQQIKVVSQLLRKANHHDYLIPNLPTNDVSEEYTGGEVLEPIRGYYNSPITTLDFASLYPSIMIAYNMCYTTWVTNTSQINTDDCTRAPNGALFVKPHIRKGILPQILDELLSARRQAKNSIKTEHDEIRKSVLDGRQLALKISANSVYGFTGAQVGKLPCLPISQGITAFGRQMIEKTKELIEIRYSKSKGFKYDAQVIYGDTDSVMVKFGFDNLQESMATGKEAAEYVSQHFQKPIQLQFEKCYYPFLLISKKRYAGLCFTHPDAHDKIDCKGIETVRRDNCPLVANCISICLRKLLIERAPEDAVEHVKQVISDILCNRTDISQLIITKEITKSDYAAKQAHVELADKLRKRNPGNSPNLGDRIPYVIVAGAKGEPAYKRAEDPVFVLDNNLPLDSRYYLENQLSKPILRILEPVLGDRAESMLFKGSHTLTKTQVTARTGGLLAFTRKKSTCVVCKTVLPDSKQNDAVGHLKL